ncbi:uncharacterized protein TM35_000017100 [Trypanosoma theileri]|uniref:Roadblock/LAMTOR2 domain-containing protein n=1 Tax=Trypanosoma theileri TaxID=67003 RepID=A0A1X0PB28_9TRYP|nr:uncharacterized protein TM35_000017100 [Trypanosoma theileri]ORC93833.1 hypothetical protein TM35_000017100 [Trypanosoma theileri]
MNQTGWVKDRLLNQGANHFVIFSSLGHVLESSGDFQDEENQKLAFTIMQQSSQVLKSGESLRRITMTFDDVVYIATTITGQGENLGVFVKRPAADVLISN